MKARNLFLALLILFASGVQTTWAQKVLLYKSNGQTVEYEVEELDSIVFKERVSKLVTSIVLSETSITLQPDETKRLTATVVPSDAANPAVTWASSDEAVATVVSNGLVVAVANGTCTITCAAKDGSGVKAECKVMVKSGTTPDPASHEWVDLGLPSGTLWATCNIGASKPEEYGDYFAWGETLPKTTYDWSTYKYCGGSSMTMMKYCTRNYYGYNGFTDDLTKLLPEDDAATVNWGNPWRMPTETQIQELYGKCSCQWTMLNGVNGILMTGPNGNTIFLPAAGYHVDTSLSNAGSNGYYWSSSLYQSDCCYAYRLYFNSSNWGRNDNYRYYGQSVRPVRVGSSATTLVTSISVNPSTLTLGEGVTQTLAVTVLPSDATNKAVTWSSDNSGVATVSASGMVTAKAVGTCTITCSAADGSDVKGECQVTVKRTGINGHAYVEIGGLKWATMNVGATTVAGSYATCYGDYYAWGETQPRYASITRKGTNYATFSWRSRYSDGYSSNNYPAFTGTKLDASHDAATANWGSTWRTPTMAEFKSLAKACSGSSSYTPTRVDFSITEGGIYWLSSTQTVEPAYTGVAGILFVSKEDISKRVFFPASGHVVGTSLFNGNVYGYYWSSSFYTLDSSRDTSYYLYFDSSGVNPSNDSRRYCGFTVRPVSD